MLIRSGTANPCNDDTSVDKMGLKYIIGHHLHLLYKNVPRKVSMNLVCEIAVFMVQIKAVTDLTLISMSLMIETTFCRALASMFC